MTENSEHCHPGESHAQGLTTTHESPPFLDPEEAGIQCFRLIQTPVYVQVVFGLSHKIHDPAMRRAFRVKP